jgi:hypothetical protein
MIRIQMFMVVETSCSGARASKACRRAREPSRPSLRWPRYTRPALDSRCARRRSDRAGRDGRMAPPGGRTREYNRRRTDRDVSRTSTFACALGGSVILSTSGFVLMSVEGQRVYCAAKQKNSPSPPVVRKSFLRQQAQLFRPDVQHDRTVEH